MNSLVPPSLLLPLTLAGCLFIPDSAVANRLSRDPVDSDGELTASPDDDTADTAGHMPTFTLQTTLIDSGRPVAPYVDITVDAVDADGDLQTLTIIPGAGGIDLVTDANIVGETGTAYAHIALDPCTRGTETTFIVTAVDAEGRTNSESVGVTPDGQAFAIDSNPHITRFPTSLCGSLSVNATFTMDRTLFTDGTIDGYLLWQGMVTDYTTTGENPILSLQWDDSPGGSNIYLLTETENALWGYGFGEGWAPEADYVWTNRVQLLDVEDVSGSLTLRPR